MKINFILSLILCTSLACFAQGYKDGIEYYNVGQYDNAKELLLRNLDDPSTDKSEAYYYLGCIELVAGNDAEAVKYFDQGVAANPKNFLTMQKTFATRKTRKSLLPLVVHTMPLTK